MTKSLAKKTPRPRETYYPLAAQRARDDQNPSHLSCTRHAHADGFFYGERHAAGQMRSEIWDKENEKTGHDFDVRAGWVGSHSVSV